MVLSQSMPTQQEQANLLLNVQEVFEQVKLLTKDEAEATDISVRKDVEAMVKRAEYILVLLEEVTLLRLSCDINTVCMLEGRTRIQELGQKGRQSLVNCTTKTKEAVIVNSDQLLNITTNAIDHGQGFLDSLESCSKKGPLVVMSCYRNVIVKNSTRVKDMLLGSIDVHKVTHLETIKIRENAQDCVDVIIKKYKGLFEEIFTDTQICK